MAETADFKQMLETRRSLSQIQQEAVLNFARSLQATSTKQPLNLSLQQIAKLRLLNVIKFWLLSLNKISIS